MIISENNYFNTNRDFYTDYLTASGTLECKLVFTNKVSKKVVNVEESITIDSTLNRYFIFPLTLSLLETGFHTFILYIKNDNGLGDYIEYEKGLGLVPFDEPDIYTNTENDDDDVYIVQ